MEKLQKTQDYDPFCYTASKLSAAETQFRLLELLPSTAEQSELSCRILVSQLGQSSRKYKALSYAWGNGRMSHSITVLPAEGSEGKRTTLAITESLHTALVHLRHTRQSIWLWVDQICIHQKDHVEKGNQVELMGRIYAGAEQVLVWLGPAADGSDALMEVFLTVGRAARAFGLESYYAKRQEPLLWRMTKDTKPTDPKTIEYQALLRIGAETFAPLVKKDIPRHWFARPWFTRAWTIQEFCLCADTAFVCGAKTVQAELVEMAIGILRISFLGPSIGIYSSAGVYSELWDIIFEDPTASLFSCRQGRLRFDRGEPGATGDQLHVLMRELYVGHNTQAWLHRDRIFSVLSLAVDAPLLGLTPDYSEQDNPAVDARILTLAARAMLTNPATGNLTILSYAQPPKTPVLAPHLPSWVPDWCGDLRPSFYKPHMIKHHFAACGPAHLAVHPLPLPAGIAAANPRVLGLGGFRVDTISAVAADQAWTDMSWDAGRFRGVLEQVDGLFERGMVEHAGVPVMYGGDGDRRAEARWRVPIGGLFLTRAEGVQRAVGGEVVAYRRFVEVLRFIGECENAGADERVRRFEAWDWEGKKEREELGAEYRDSMVCMVGKRPFLTSEGYLGMGPAGVEVGDVVVVFCGASIPFVLRPTASELELDVRNVELFELVGEAYCDGVMDGEVVDHQELSEFYLL